MNILNDKNIRMQFTLTVVVLFLFVYLCQITMIHMADDYKKNMIAHDYAIAGYLSKNGVDDSLIVKAFTSEKSAKDTAAGSARLSTAGYKDSLENVLLPDVFAFQKKYLREALALFAVFSLIILTVFYYFTRRRDKRIIEAGQKVRLFLDGDRSIRLDASLEGNLSRFFSAVNNMATSLTAHIEKEKQNKEFLKETISDISHQLKTPLAALQMYNEIIMGEKTGNEVVENFMVKSRDELLRMENLIQNLMKLARLDAGTIELEKSVHNLGEFFHKCLATFLTRAEVEGKEIILCGDAEATLSFDETWLNEAVGNILKNALDHTEAGDQIEISWEETVVTKEIVIKDSGEGIHPDDIHYIFKRFYRSRFSKDKQGIGIGLALAKAVIEKHGGTISVQSKPGSGAEFHLIFPKLSDL